MYSALKSIPAELYEAAEIDGASQMATGLERQDPDDPARHPPDRHLLGHRELPDLQRAEPAAELAPTAITQSFTPNFYAYNLAFVNQDINYAAAIAFLLGFVIMIVSYVVQLSTQRRERHVVTARSPLLSPGPSRAGAASRPHRDKRRSNLLTVVMWLCVLYFIVPLIWLFISSTKDNARPVLDVRAVVRPRLQPVRRTSSTCSRTRRHLPALDAEHASCTRA